MPSTLEAASPQVSSRSARRRSPVVHACAALILGLTALDASAQPLSQPSVAVERMRLATDRSGVISVEGGRVQEHLRWDAGAWFGMSRDPLIVYRVADGGREGTLVGDRFSGSFTASVGLWDFAQLALELPFVMAQSRQTSGSLGAMPALSSTAVGDARIVPKVQVLTESAHGIDLALLAGFTIPIGSSSSFVGSGGLVVAPEIALSRTLRNLRFAAAVGAVLRPSRTIENVEFGNELTAELGAAYRPSTLRALEMQAALAAATSASRAFAHTNETPAELRGMATYDVTASVQFAGGAGIGVTTGWGTPAWRTFFGIRFAPGRGTAP